MPDEVQTNHPGGVIPEHYEMHKRLLEDLWKTWGKHRDLNKPKYHEFYRVAVVTLTQQAATLAVDVNMTEEQFLATCKANFQEALRRAPRWG
jgi:hypothetical protein